MNNEALYALVSFVDRIIEQWVDASTSIDPEYSDMNDMCEQSGLEMKTEFRSLLDAVLGYDDLG